MSERGSVASQYFYCRTCCEATLRVFEQWYEYETPVVVRQADGSLYPIIVAAKAHCSYLGEELDEFENDVAPALAEALCHKARFAILADDEKHAGIAEVTPGEPDCRWVFTSRQAASA
jgi:hypothetical protein